MDANQVEHGRQWLQELLSLTGMSAAVEANPNPPFSEDSCWLTIDQASFTPQQIETLIGPGGAVLDSIQYLANATLNLGKGPEQQGAFTVELAGYRLRRYEELKVMAERAANQVRQTGEEFELRSLSSAERRQVHTLLKAYDDLETYSRGQEPDRRLVVRLLQSEF